MQKRPRTDKQQAALVKARAALLKKRTCERCGDYDPSCGLQKHSDARIYTRVEDGVPHRSCISCLHYFKWLATRQGIEQRLHTLFTERTPFLILDTETTGLGASRTCQIVEIALIDQDGLVVYHSLCKPDIALPASATEVNGITDALLTGAPTFVQLWPDLVQLLASTPAPLYAWNADFDREVLLRTAKRFGLLVPEALTDTKRWNCAMKLHARWYGEWSNGRNTYRWQPLAWACMDLEIEENEQQHRALGDVQNTLRVLRALADRANSTHPLPTEMPSHARYSG